MGSEMPNLGSERPGFGSGGRVRQTDRNREIALCHRSSAPPGPLLKEEKGEKRERERTKKAKEGKREG